MLGLQCSFIYYLLRCLLNIGLPQSLSSQYCTIYIILYLSTNCMLPLVILGFPRLILVHFLRFSLSLPKFGCTWLNLANVSVSSEILCSLWLKSVQLGLFLSYFHCDFYLINTRFVLTKEWLVHTKERFIHTISL